MKETDCTCHVGVCQCLDAERDEFNKSVDAELERIVKSIKGFRAL